MQTAEAIEDALRTAGFQDVKLVDRAYSLSTRDYFPGLGNRFARFLQSAGLRYGYDFFDCDDFALQATAYAKLEHARAGIPTALAVGMAQVMLGVDPHMVVAAVHLEDQALRVRLYEPQPSIPDGAIMPAFPLCLCEQPLSLYSALLWSYM